MVDRVVPFRELSAEDEARIQNFNWILCLDENTSYGNWHQAVDQRYGTINHVAILDSERQIAFDKIDLEWKPAVFDVVHRRNTDKFGRVEFLLPTERRILLKDENGIRGNTYIRNIPQGLTKRDETLEQAAIREATEEVGELPIVSITRVQDIYFDAANSSTATPYFLIEVKYQPLGYQQNLDDTEKIVVGEEDWFALEDIHDLKLQCAKTLSGLMLATGYLGLINKR